MEYTALGKNGKSAIIPTFDGGYCFGEENGKLANLGERNPLGCRIKTK